MVDPLAQVVALLRPGAPFSKIATGAGAWRIRRTQAGRPFYCAMLDGACRLAVVGHEPVILEKGDFALVPAPDDFTVSSLDPALVDTPSVAMPNGEYRLGRQTGPHDARWLVGYCVFGSADAALLVSLLPKLVYVRGERRLTTIVQLVIDEFRARRPAGEMIMERLLEVLLIEVLRSAAGTTASTGLLRGLADERLAVAIRRLHEDPARPWTVVQLAKEAALSRSAFFERFRRTVGVAPMEYLLAWRMALAKSLLKQKGTGIAEVAERVGYRSASAFSIAFARHVGQPPARYARRQMAGAATG